MTAVIRPLSICALPASSTRRPTVARPAGKSCAASSSAHCAWRSNTASCESVIPTGGSVLTARPLQPRQRRQCPDSSAVRLDATTSSPHTAT